MEVDCTLSTACYVTEQFDVELVLMRAPSENVSDAARSRLPSAVTGVMICAIMQ